MRRFSIFLVAVVLVAGVVACGQPVQYSLTIFAMEGGEITTPGEGTSSYEEGTEVSLVALPNAGYRFAGWTGDVYTIGNINSASTTITMNSDYSVTANFALVQYDLTVSSTQGGSVTTPGQGTGSFTYNEGMVVNLVAQPDEGYQFTEWSGNVGTIADVSAAQTTITMDSAYSITACFAKGIWDWYDLDAIRENLEGTYILMNGLDSATAGYVELASQTANQEKGWEPIGGLHDPFIGSFNGQTHEIRDLRIRRSGGDWVGLFGCVRTEGVLQNLKLINLEVVGNSYVGGLAGQIYDGTVNGCESTGSVGGDSCVGGLVGVNCEGGTIRDTYSACFANGTRCVGGLVGENAGGTVSNSYSGGRVSSKGRVGGLVGDNWAGTVSCSYATGTVTGEFEVGGLVGHNYYSSVVINCYATGSVLGDQHLGGLIGYNYVGGIITDCYAVGEVTGNSSVGGLVGFCEPSDAVASFWDAEASGCAESDAGTARTTSQMREILTFSRLSWDIVAVAHDEINQDYTWNIIDGETYPFLSWQA